MLKLYSYFRSSASYRVRLALHWKELSFETIAVHLLKEGGQQRWPEFRKINPMAHLPALDHDGFIIAESMAIIQYLDDLFPQKRLFPTDPKERAQVVQVCEILNSGIQPLQNLKVTQCLESDFGLSKDDVNRWTQKWITSGLQSLEDLLTQTAGTYCVGGQFTAADCFLIPQCFSSRRFGISVENYPTIARIEASALQLPGLAAAHPNQQPDYTP